MNIKDALNGFLFDKENKEEATTTASINEPAYDQDTAHSYQEQKKAIKKPELVHIPVKEKGADADNMEIVLVKAANYDEMLTIAGHIKERKITVVNFENMDKNVSQRMVDFLSGATFALDGSPKKVSGATFIFSPAKTSVSGQIMENDGARENKDATDPVLSNNNFLNS